MRKVLLDNFLRISKIPRMSGNEKQISNFFVEIAKKNKLEYYQDENYNVLIKKKGNIDGKTIALQAHLDMVCQKKEDSKHDFNKDGIDVIIENDKVTAKDTTLGADQGVGLAIMLSLIEDSTLKHPNLEFLFTVEEETTFKGAITFPYDKVKARKMINLDYCRDDAIIIGSAGDIVNEYSYMGNFKKRELPSYKLTIKAKVGGNSGENIEESSNNAINLMAKMLKDKDIYLKSIDGGTFENDIATSCEAVIQTEVNVKETFNKHCSSIETIENRESLSKENTQEVLKEILELKSGSFRECSSANLGVVKTEGRKITIDYLIRSTKEEELDLISKNSIQLNNNFSVKNLYKDRIWKLDYESQLFKDYKEVYYSLYKKYPKEAIAQGGLEIASIQKRIDNLDIISIGATMENFHTVNETTYISSWLKIYNIIINLLKYK